MKLWGTGPGKWLLERAGWFLLSICSPGLQWPRGPCHHSTPGPRAFILKNENQIPHTSTLGARAAVASTVRWQEGGRARLPTWGEGTPASQAHAPTHGGGILPGREGQAVLGGRALTSHVSAAARVPQRQALQALRGAPLTKERMDCGSGGATETGASSRDSGGSLEAGQSPRH